MKQFFKTMMAVACLVLGVSTLSAQTTTPLVFNQQLTLTKGLGTIYSYKPTTNGTLTLSFPQGGDNSVVFTTTSGSGPVYASSTSGNDSNYDLNANVTYYIYNTNYYVDQYVIASWEASDAPVEEGTFTPMTVTKVALNEAVSQSATYNSFTYTTDGTISGPNTCIEFTAEQNGKLVITQGASFESHLYLVAWNKMADFDSNANIYPADYPGEVAGSIPLTYVLDQGATYYFYAKVGTYDNITSMSYSWTPSGSTEDIPEAQLNEAFNCYNKVYKYTAPYNGVMSVVLSAYSNEIVDFNNLVYANANCTTKVDQLGREEYGDSQYLVSYYLEGGKTYYFKQTNNEKITCTIVEMIAKEQALILDVANLNPVPGDSSWNENIYNYGSGFQYRFNPSDVTIQSVTVSYVNQNGQTVTDTYMGNNASQMEYMGGGWIVRLYDSLAAFKASGKENTYLTVTLNNIRYNGKQMPIELSETTDARSYINIDNQTGSISFQYFKANQEMTYNSTLSKWPATIYQTWEEGDANGIATLIFSNPIKTIGDATVTLGSQTWGAAGGGDDPDPSVSIPYEINNNVLTLYFNKAEEIPTGTKSYSQCTIFVTGVTDIYGQGMGIPSVDMKLPYSATTAPDPVKSMPDFMVIQPEGNNYSLALNSFVVQWAENALTATGSAMTATVYIDEKSVGTAPISITKGLITGVNDCLTVDVSQYFGQYGAFMVYIPQGIVKNEEGAVNAAQYLSCYVYEENDNYTITPAPGELQALDEEIKITFEGCSLAINADAGGVEWANNTIPSSVAYDSLVIPMVSIAKGTYTLKVPATYLVINGNQLNPAIEETYIVLTSGVEGLIDADANGAYVVYNLNGVKVAEGNEEVVKSLAKGLYIINGKKVIVK